MEILEPLPDYIKIHYTEEGSSETTLDKQQQTGLLQSLHQAIQILSNNGSWTIDKLTELLQPSAFHDQSFGNKNEMNDSIR